METIGNMTRKEDSTNKIKNKMMPESIQEREKFSFNPTTVGIITNLLNALDTKKAVGIDTITPKLIKMTSEFLAPFLITMINSSIKNSVFPNIPDKGEPNKNNILNFRLVNLLNTFSKIFERVIEDQLIVIGPNSAIGSVLTDLSKAFDCIAPGFLIAKHVAYSFSDKAFRFIYSNLKNQTTMYSHI